MVWLDGIMSWDIYYMMLDFLDILYHHVSPIYTWFIDGMVVGIGGIMQQFACFRFVGYNIIYGYIYIQYKLI